MRKLTKTQQYVIGAAAVLVVIALVVAGVLLSRFRISGDEMIIDNLSLTADTVTFGFSAAEPGRNIRDYEYRRDGNAVYVTFYGTIFDSQKLDSNTITINEPDISLVCIE